MRDPSGEREHRPARRPVRDRRAATRQHSQPDRRRRPRVFRPFDGRPRGGSQHRPVVVESWWFRPRDLELIRAGVRDARTVEVWCDVDPALARQRFAARHRPALHEDADRLAQDWDRWAADGEPLGLGPVVRVDTSTPVDVAGVLDRIARSTAGTGPEPPRN